MNQIRLILVMLAGSLALIGCASFEVELAKKPGFKKVKKVALVGIVGNRQGFMGQSIGSSINMMTALISPDTKTEESSDDKESRAVLNRLITKGMDVYAKELAKVPGWKIVPYSKIGKTKAYASFRREMAKVQKGFAKDFPRFAKLYQMGTIVPPKMAYVPAVYKGNKGERKPWRDLARRTKVDATASMWFYVSYKFFDVPVRLVKGIVMVTFQLVDKKGRVVIETPQQIGTFDFKTLPGFGEYGDGTMLEFGQIELDEDFEPLLMSSIEKSAVMLRNTLIQEYGGTVPKE